MTQKPKGFTGLRYSFDDMIKLYAHSYQDRLLFFIRLLWTLLFGRLGFSPRHLGLPWSDRPAKRKVFYDGPNFELDTYRVQLSNLVWTD